MSKMHNLGTVFKFETVRVLKKPTFWAMALGFPLMFAALYGIMFWSQSAMTEAAKELKKQEFSLAITDDSKLIKPELLSAMNAKIVMIPVFSAEDAFQSLITSGIITLSSSVSPGDAINTL